MENKPGSVVDALHAAEISRVINSAGISQATLESVATSSSVPNGAEIAGDPELPSRDAGIGARRAGGGRLHGFRRRGGCQVGIGERGIKLGQGAGESVVREIEGLVGQGRGEGIEQEGVVAGQQRKRYRPISREISRGEYVLMVTRAVLYPGRGHERARQNPAGEQVMVEDNPGAGAGIVDQNVMPSRVYVAGSGVGWSAVDHLLYRHVSGGVHVDRGRTGDGKVGDNQNQVAVGRRQRPCRGEYVGVGRSGGVDGQQRRLNAEVGPRRSRR